MKKRAIIGMFVVMSLSLLGLTGCYTPPKPEKRIVTLKHPELLKKYDMIPVQKAWKDPRIDLSKYDKIIVDRVEIPRNGIKLTEMEKTNLDSVLGVHAAQVRKFADYTAEAFKKAIQADPRLKLVTQPGPNTMILQLALVKVVPGKPLLGILRNVPIPVGKASFIITPAIKLVGGSVDGLQSTVSIEGELLDSQTRRVIAMFADKEKETAAVINTALMRSYGTPEEIVDDWANLFVKVLNRKKGEKIEHPNKAVLINLK